MLMFFMDWQWISIISLALSMDAFAVSISCGIKLKEIALNKYFKIAISFAIFQAVMPILGWYAGNFLRSYVESITTWITFSVFLILALKTLYDALFSKKANGCLRCFCTSWSCLLSLALATSIDAFIIGIVFALNIVTIWYPILLIGAVTLCMSIVGAFIGHRAGVFLGKWASVSAGVILLGLAIKAIC